MSRSDIPDKTLKKSILAESKSEIALAAGRSVLVGAGTVEAPGIWMLLPAESNGLLRGVTPVEAKQIGQALIAAAVKAEGRALDSKNSRRRQGCLRCNQLLPVIAGQIESHMAPPSPYGNVPRECR